MIKFCINPGGEPPRWKIGHAGHLELKEAFHDEVEPQIGLNGLNLVVASNTNLPLEDGPLVNMAATLIKSRKHLNFLTGTTEFNEPNNSPWKTYQSTANLERVANTLPAWIKLDHEQRVLTVRLWPPCTKTKAVVLATLRRVVNLLEWACKVELKLTSLKCFKWSTFNSISVNQIYIRPV